MIKNHYESYIIVDGNYEDNVIEEIIKKYEAFFKKNEVEIKNTDRIGRRRMAYQIKKKQNGFYVCFEIIASTSMIAKLERTYKLDENIIRSLTIIMDKKTQKEKDDYLKKKTMMAEAAAREAKAAAEAEVAAVASTEKTEK
ncbi:MAG: 30S ribosomal protein S6 [Ignavibacteriae bacterium]|nr:30S ribosomal protein S6 [Ignavibacteriota bacterium]